MLASLVGGQVAAGLVLRGASDLWAQSVVLLVLIAGVSLLLCAAVLRGRMPIASRGPLAWAAALSALSLVSACASPVAAYSLPAWAAAAAGLFLFPAATLLSSQARVRAERIIYAASWVLVLLAAHQRLDGVPRPPSALLNANAFAGTILLLLPMAARRKDWVLTAGLLVCLWWTRSVGAWLGLSAAVLLHRRSVGPAAFWAGAAVGFAGLVAAYAKLHSPEVLHRVEWWMAAGRMAVSAPWLGLGPGSFAYALPAHVAARPELNSLYAHSHFLETAAEKGWPYLLVWGAGLASMLRRAQPSRRFGPVAALVHGLVDYPLSIPGIFWLFCLSTALCLPESDEGAAVRGPRKIPAVAFVLVLAWLAGAWTRDNWRADRLRAKAAESFLAASEALRPHPEAARLRAQLLLSRAGEGDDVVAAGHLERAVAMDPYRASNWVLLEQVYSRLGRPADAAAARARGARSCPTLRGAP
ncbi:MAG: O-antigen ligase family protein [Elusimicrobiota bacterium]